MSASDDGWSWKGVAALAVIFGSIVALPASFFAFSHNTDGMDALEQKVEFIKTMNKGTDAILHAHTEMISTHTFMIRHLNESCWCSVVPDARSVDAWRKTADAGEKP